MASLPTDPFAGPAAPAGSKPTSTGDTSILGMSPAEMTSFMSRTVPTAEGQRLLDDGRRKKNWKRWGPYLAERQWGTVREDYSADGTCWDYLPHEHARSRAYRWGEDGLLGITDRECRLCFALALWNGKDPILKERLFGLSGPEGNHGEDVKEEYFYTDSTPTHSYMRSVYRYPQAAFPYAKLVQMNRSRRRDETEFELADTGIFEGNRFFDVESEYAKAAPNDILIKVTITNRGPETAPVHVLPTVWFRNTWVWGTTHEAGTLKPRIARHLPGRLTLSHETLEPFWFEYPAMPGGQFPEVLFTDNETNFDRLFGTPNQWRWVKDAFHDYVTKGRRDTINPKDVGTKAAPHYAFNLKPGESTVLRLRLVAKSEADPGMVSREFDTIFDLRKKEADEFYNALEPGQMTVDERRIVRQAYAGLLQSKQFYHLIIDDWLNGDPSMPTPPENRRHVRNTDWGHLFSKDVISMPDKWEYPWFAAWDTAFHMIPFARIDPQFAKDQLLLFLREWYMHPNGQIPAYEFAFGDVNPPVHAWAAWRVYKITGAQGHRDREFLERVFQKLLLNFTWWINRKDASGKNLFAGGFLGLDNIGVFDRSKPLPTGGTLHQADGTAWMAFYCSTMLAMAIELAHDEHGRLVRAYEDMASKFLEHFVQIADAINTAGGTGLWDEKDGFYYDQLVLNGETIPLRTRSLVGLLPLIAVEVFDEKQIKALPGFYKRFEWFNRYRTDLGRFTSCGTRKGTGLLLSIPTRERLESLLKYLFNEAEFLSPYGIRSLSRFHEAEPFIFKIGDSEYSVRYTPGESDTWLFGGNSNWRGPVWFPVNYLLIEALERYHRFYGDDLKVTVPGLGDGSPVTLRQAAGEIERRLVALFMPDKTGRRPCFGDDKRFESDPAWSNLHLFHEYFHADTGKGLGATHQTGWTALVIRHIEGMAGRRKT